MTYEEQYRAEMAQRAAIERAKIVRSIKLAGLGFIALLALGLVLGSFYTVDSGERAIVTRFGTVESVEADGLHLKVPYLTSVTKVDIRTQKAHSPANASTNDLQNTATQVSLNYHLDGSKLADTYTRIGLEIEEKVIDPRIQETVKAVVAQFTAEELIKQRETVKDQIVTELRAGLARYNVVLEDVQITDFQFSKAFDDAIEAKQTAEQKALQAKNDLDRIKVEAQQKIATAQAEAEAIRIQTAAIKEQGGAAYVQLKAIDKWDGALPQVAGGNTPFINLTPK